MAAHTRQVLRLDDFQLDSMNRHMAAESAKVADRHIFGGRVCAVKTRVTFESIRDALLDVFSEVEDVKFTVNEKAKIVHFKVFVPDHIQYPNKRDYELVVMDLVPLEYRYDVNVQRTG
jgi:DNA gyrase inhibitor GyrI